MSDNNQLLQKFILELQKIIMGNYKKCHFLIESQGLKPECKTLRGLATLQGRYLEIERQYNTGTILLRDWDEYSKIYIARMNECLSNLEEEELEEGTLEIFFQEKEEENQKHTEGGDDGIVFENSENIEELFSNKERIVLERISIDKIIIPEDSDILNTPERRYEFRKRMMIIQDYLTLESYGKALDECEFILKNLELQSSQLHEYHTISYFKASGEEYGIIQDIQNQKEDTLKKLALCIKRFRLFNENKNKILTFENNVKYICFRMSLILREYYRGSEYNYNYINRGDNPDLRKLVCIYLKTGLSLVTDIYKGNIPITVFLEDALLEINGGRKLNWLEVTVDWKIRNRDSFRALEMQYEIINILKKTNSWDTSRKRLYRNLAIKYSNLKISNRKNSSTLEVRQAFRRFFKASIIAYKCYEDTRFLELFKAELLHMGKLDWFELSETGKLIANSECNQIGYDPNKDLARLQSYFNQSEFQMSRDTLYSELKRQREIKIIRDKVEETDNRYETLKRNTINKDIYFRKEIIDCIHDWESAYKEVKFDNIISKAIKELIGKESLLFWFELNENAELINHHECHNLDFDAKKNLNIWLDNSKDYYQIKDSIWKEIRLKAAEIMAHEANLKYQQIYN